MRGTWRVPRGLRAQQKPLRIRDRNRTRTRHRIWPRSPKIKRRSTKTARKWKLRPRSQTTDRKDKMLPYTYPLQRVQTFTTKGANLQRESKNTQQRVPTFQEKAKIPTNMSMRKQKDRRISQAWPQHKGLVTITHNKGWR